MNFISSKMQMVKEALRKRRIARLSRSRSSVKFREEIPGSLPVPTYIQQDAAYNAAMNRYMEAAQQAGRNPLLGQFDRPIVTSTYAPTYVASSRDFVEQDIRRIVDVKVVDDDDEDEPPTSLQITSEVR